MEYKNKNVAVLGFGIEGRDTVDYLIQEGANITVFDKQEIKEDREGVRFVTGENYLEKGLLDFDVIVRSPGFYRFSKEILEAENKGTLITSPIKIFFDKCPAKIIGVTGTKGKGTTTTLIKEILTKDDRKTFLVGNIGKPYLEILPQLDKESFVVMEMSSFQLFDLTVGPYISVVLNITSDHLDWHKNIDEYIDAKKNIVLHQTKEDFAVINEEYGVPKSFAKLTKANVVFFSKEKLDNKFKKQLLLRGEHNLENIAAAVAVAKILKVGDKIIEDVVSNFRGLEHRLELVDMINNISFYNDSFATGPQPTIAALKSFNEEETLILGGSDKGLDYDELGEEIAKRENIKNVILIGDMGKRIKNSLIKANYKNKILELGKSSMEDIVKKSYEVTSSGGVVILSPAAASFDMFLNYKDRGNQFKDCVRKLK